MGVLGGFDWETATGITTGVATLIIAALTLLSTRTARRAADAAESVARVSNAELHEAHRPVLVPGPLSVAGHDVLVEIQNIGVGPALRVYGRAQTADLPEGVRGRFARPMLPGLAAGATGHLRFSSASLDSHRLTSLKITYASVVGCVYTTDAHWDRRHDAFSHVRVEDGDQVRIPMRVRLRPGRRPEVQPADVET